MVKMVERIKTMSEYISCLVTAYCEDYNALIRIAIRIKHSDFPGDSRFPSEPCTKSGLHKMLPAEMQTYAVVVEVVIIDDVITL